MREDSSWYTTFVHRKTAMLFFTYPLINPMAKLGDSGQVVAKMPV
jgi:hypothetical protein